MVLLSAKAAAKSHQKQMTDSTVLRNLSPTSVFCGLTGGMGLPFTILKGKDTTSCQSRIQQREFVWFQSIFPPGPQFQVFIEF